MNKILMVLIITAVLLLNACGSGPRTMIYRVDQNAKQYIWPEPPDRPRFKYVGELLGEQNLKDKERFKGLGEMIVDGFRWLVGLKGSSGVPVVLQRPQTGAVDSTGRILVSDVSRQGVFVFDEKKGEITIFYQADPERVFHTPIGVAVGELDSVFIVDAEHKGIYHLDVNGQPIKSFGMDVLKRPSGIARDPVLKQLYVADTHGHDIKVFNDKGDLIDTIGRRGEKIGEFNSPTHVAFRNDRLYVTDTFNTRVQILTREGDFLGNFGNRGTYVGDLVRPKGVTTDSDGNVYVIESFHDYLLVYNSGGEYLMPIGGTGTGIGEFFLPSGIWADDRDRIYIADMFNGRVVILQYLGGNFSAGTKYIN